MASVLDREEEGVAMNKLADRSSTSSQIVGLVEDFSRNRAKSIHSTSVLTSMVAPG